MMTTTTQKAVEAINSNGPHTDTNGANSRTVGATKQTPIGVFTKSGAALQIDTPNATGWRGALAASNAGFKKSGAFSEIVGGRRARRAQERQQLNAATGLLKIMARAKKASKA